LHALSFSSSTPPRQRVRCSRGDAHADSTPSHCWGSCDAYAE
jgi:hypothetical protein